MGILPEMKYFFIEIPQKCMQNIINGISLRYSIKNMLFLPMKHFTLSPSFEENTIGQFDDVPEMHASLESLFLLRVFARTYGTAI